MLLLATAMLLIVKAWHYLATAIVMFAYPKLPCALFICAILKAYPFERRRLRCRGMSRLALTNAAVHAYVRLVVAHRHKVRQAPQGLENMKFAIESTGCENDVLTKSIEGCTEPSLLNSSKRQRPTHAGLPGP